MAVATGDAADVVEPDARAPALYVYGFVRAGAVRDVREEGVGGADVTVLAGKDVAAIVSPLADAELRLKRRDLHRHLKVIESVFDATTILPCAFGTVVESARELEEGVLLHGRDDLLAGLTRLDGTVQMNVKAVYDEEELLRQILRSDPQVAALRDRTRGAGAGAYGERVRLGETVAARVAEQAEVDEARLTDVLVTDAIDVAVERPEAGSALRASFLVARKSLRRFEKTLESVARAEQPLLRFEAIGPLPPTAFASAYASSEA